MAKKVYGIEHARDNARVNDIDNAECFIEATMCMSVPKLSRSKNVSIDVIRYYGIDT
jgi:hypothetical protein